MGQSNDLPRRETFNLNIAVNNDNFYCVEMLSSEIVLPDNSIQIYPGEKLFIEIEYVKNEIKRMKSVKKNLNPGMTLVISFSQKTDGKIHKEMILKMENPFKKKLIYRANMFLMKPNLWEQTSVIPVVPKRISYETWSYIIITLALSGWEFR